MNQNLISKAKKIVILKFRCIIWAKFILKRESSKLNLSQSEYIRNLIVGYEIKIPKIKEEPKPKKEEYTIEN